MNSGWAKRARREVDAAQRNVPDRIKKLNWLLRADLSNADLRRSLGEDAEINFPVVVKLLAMVLSPLLWSYAEFADPASRTMRAQ